MLFSDAIPDRVLDNRNTKKFCDVLDALNIYKFSRINEALGFFNPVVSMKKEWIIKALEDYGFFNIPENYPIEPLVQLLVNANNVVSLKGSKRGLYLWLSVMTLGEVSFDDSDVLPIPRFLIPDSPEQGFITESTDYPIFYLVSNSDELSPMGHLTINISSVFFNREHYSIEVMDSIKDYLEKEVLKWICFSEYVSLNFSYSSGTTKVYDELLNNKFI